LGLAVAVATGSRGDETKVDGDLKALQGVWVSQNDQGETTRVFKGSHLSVKAPGRAYEFTIKLDSVAKP